ncbi:uncharacterized protein N7515_001018 [Penicillium bovifimosum]|uniref:Uncharacterized protein n=1 Tax=Penicillium bovifimosum TaxID=126998 RepID=A0A9W9LAE3_9EURO|nr:uncharacterized protein N7515_001018 [Penicillium bovifimosum]KAJ5146454.1 hypothetical protein N7515_001018 [Penicillium bovifimosum]
MSEIRVVLRRRSVAKRWLRSWVFTPLGSVKIKLINKIERKRYRSVPDTELKRMVLDALIDRYPTRHFRDHSRVGTLSSGRTSMINDEYNLSVLELGLMSRERKARFPDRSFRWEKGTCHRAKQVKAVTLAVATVQPHQRDRRSSWRGELNEPSKLRVLNPDLPPSSSEEVEHSSLSSTSETESFPVELPVIVLTTPDSPQQHFSNDSQFEQPETISSSGVDLSSRPVIAELDAAPRLPDLDFIDRPTMPLCCSITQALRYSKSSIHFEQGVCSCSTSVQLDTSDLCQLLSTFTNNHELPDSVTEDSSRKHTTRDESWPQPLKISKSQDCLRDKLRNGPLPPLPVSVDQHHDADATSPTVRPYSLRYKVKHGSLPPLPRPDSHFTELSHLMSSPSCYSEVGTVHESGTPSDLPSRERTSSGLASSLSLSWENSQSENNVQSTSSSLSHQLSTEDDTQHDHAIEDLPASLRAGPQWSQWQQDTVSELPNLVSSPFVDHPPTPVGDSLWSAGSLENLLATSIGGYDAPIEPLVDVVLCFGAGAAAKTRRRREYEY